MRFRFFLALAVASLAASGCFVVPEDIVTAIRVDDVAAATVGDQARGTVKLMIVNQGSRTLYLDFCGTSMHRYADDERDVVSGIPCLGIGGPGSSIAPGEAYPLDFAFRFDVPIATFEDYYAALKSTYAIELGLGDDEGWLDRSQRTSPRFVLWDWLVVHHR